MKNKILTLIVIMSTTLLIVIGAVVLFRNYQQRNDNIGSELTSLDSQLGDLNSDKYSEEKINEPELTDLDISIQEEIDKELDFITSQLDDLNVDSEFGDFNDIQY